MEHLRGPWGGSEDERYKGSRGEPPAELSGAYISTKMHTSISVEAPSPAGCELRHCPPEISVRGLNSAAI